VPAAARVICYRRLMVRIAERLARQVGALALVTGDSLGQVASQTLENLSRVGEATDLPVLRPLIGMDKLEITAEARLLGTFEVSIEPDADCCTLFVPRHPGTALGRGEIEAAERRLDLERLVQMGAAAAVEETRDFPPGAGPFPKHPAREPRRRERVPE
jgi:thiamine biosynthesis protein ThiI